MAKADTALVGALRDRGLRMTAQRQMVLDAVRELDHATPEQIHVEVAGKAAGVNITTIYRTLELLSELGLVTHTHLSHGAPTYHAAGVHQHLHLVCRDCETVTELPASTVDGLVHKLREERGFELDVEHLALFGQCEDCRQRPVQD
jgi:Fur family ferric uptake transcriptional regulator